MNLGCSENCKICRNGNICDVCDEFYNLKDGNCIKHCGEGYTEINGSCKSCGRFCAKCKPENPNECLECLNNLIIYKEECVSSCPLRYFKTKNNNCESKFIIIIKDVLIIVFHVKLMQIVRLVSIDTFYRMMVLNVLEIVITEKWHLMVNAKSVELKIAFIAVKI